MLRDWISCRLSAAWLAGCLAISVGSGCALFPQAPDDEELPSSQPDWSGSWRAGTAQSNLAGLSEESRQIERNLGVR